MPTADDYWQEMQDRFKNGTIGQATKEELLAYLGALAMLQIRSGENRQRAGQMGDTIRVLLAAKENAASTAKSRVLSRLALYVSAGALILAALVALLRR